MHPQLSMLIIALFIFSITVGTIIHVLLIDVEYMKARGKRNKTFNLLIWMIVIGTAINAPIWWQVYKVMQH